MSDRGSSPLARGLQVSDDFELADWRIIPARAGFTRRHRRPARRERDHPRSRGVYFTAPAHPGGTGGSSPLARGLPHCCLLSVDRDGIIPARAGFTRGRPGRRRGDPDHPRSRGVYVSGASCSLRASGSSPLARGLRPAGTRAAGHMRIIPARAGFTTMRVDALIMPMDHPRSRGVYALRTSVGVAAFGSSPLARGLPFLPVEHETRARIIPARAGFTTSPPPTPPPRWDHPRSRGVYTSPKSPSGESSGSSPLARGLRSRPRPGNRRGGIIPARAGFTDHGLRPGRGDRDHPRSRGVYLALTSPHQGSTGSSPLARGLQP